MGMGMKKSPLLNRELPEGKGIALGKFHIIQEIGIDGVAFPSSHPAGTISPFLQFFFEIIHGLLELLQVLDSTGELPQTPIDFL